MLRSSADLIHCDFYTNGINKGKIIILQQIFHRLHLANIVAFAVLKKIKRAHIRRAWECVGVFMSS